MKNYTVKTKDGKNKKDMKGSSNDNSSRCKMCNVRHDLDVFVQAETIPWLLLSHLIKTYSMEYSRKKKL